MLGASGMLLDTFGLTADDLCRPHEPVPRPRAGHYWPRRLWKTPGNLPPPQIDGTTEAPSISAMASNTPNPIPSYAANSHERVLIIDFGSQVTQLIARRLREMGVYCEVHPYNRAEAVHCRRVQSESGDLLRRAPPA